MIWLCDTHSTEYIATCVLKSNTEVGFVVNSNFIKYLCPSAQVMSSLVPLGKIVRFGEVKPGLAFIVGVKGHIYFLWLLQWTIWLISYTPNHRRNGSHVHKIFVLGVVCSSIQREVQFYISLFHSSLGYEKCSCHKSDWLQARWPGLYFWEELQFFTIFIFIWAIHYVQYLSLVCL